MHAWYSDQIMNMMYSDDVVDISKYISWCIQLIHVIHSKSTRPIYVVTSHDMRLRCMESLIQESVRGYTVWNNSLGDNRSHRQKFEQRCQGHYWWGAWFVRWHGVLILATTQSWCVSYSVITYLIPSMENWNPNFPCNFLWNHFFLGFHNFFTLHLICLMQFMISRKWQIPLPFQQLEDSLLKPVQQFSKSSTGCFSNWTTIWRINQHFVI